MACVISLSRNPIARCQTIHVLSYIQYYTSIAIARVSGETRLPARFTPVYIIVYFRADADGRIFVLYEHAVIWYRRKFILLQYNLPEISVD